MRGFTISIRAALDLARAEERFFAYAGPTPQALERLEDLLDAVADLEHTPATWPVSARHPGTRERVVSRCKIYYDIIPDTGDNATAGDVTILHVRLPGQEEPDAV